MAATSSTGVKGFFEDYAKKGSLPNAKAVRVENAEQPKSALPEQTARGGKQMKKRARTGRPPGVPSGSRSAKAKATMHIDATLMDFYRDWSWEERCNLGQLIERAMLLYKEMRKASAHENL